MRPARGTRYETVIPHRLSPELPVPEHINKPNYYFEYFPPTSSYGEAMVQRQDVIDRMRNTCRLAATILDKCPQVLKPGYTTDELDKFVHNEIITAGAYPSPLRYASFPKSICTSVNNVIVHGIPDERPLAEGDIISVDITVYANGVHGDCCRTFPIGAIDEEAQYLIDVTELCRDEAIRICGPNVPFKEIGAIIEEIATEYKLRIVEDFVGHGIGTCFHGPPQVMHHRNKMKDVMKPGMIFTIEPILVTGSPRFSIWEDEWTATTIDDSRGAQFEHTVVIHKDGCEVLTLPAGKDALD